MKQTINAKGNRIFRTILMYVLLMTAGISLLCACNTAEQTTETVPGDTVLPETQPKETEPPVPKDPIEVFGGKTLTLLGDSITEGVGVTDPALRYATVLTGSLEMQENNMGISGTVICTGGHRTSRLGDVEKIPQDSDYVCVLLGVNDFDQCRNDGTSYYYALGEMGSKDTTTIYGALDQLCASLAERFADTETKVFLMTPVATSWNNSLGSARDWDQDKKNACGYSLRELCDAILQVGEQYGLDTFDLHAECDLMPEDFSDGIHPNNSGAAKMAEAIREYMIETYMR